MNTQTFYDDDLPDFDTPVPTPPAAETETLTIQECAALALAQSRAAAEQWEAAQAAQEREERNRDANRIVKRYLDIEATAVDGRVTVDGITLLAYSRRDSGSYSRIDYLRMVAPCPYCGEETHGPDMALIGRDAWVALGEQLENFTPDSPDHLNGRCVRQSAAPSDPPTPAPTPAQVLLDALTAYIDQVCQRHANDE